MHLLLPVSHDAHTMSNHLSGARKETISAERNLSEETVRETSVEHGVDFGGRNEPRSCVPRCLSAAFTSPLGAGRNLTPIFHGITLGIIYLKTWDER